MAWNTVRYDRVQNGYARYGTLNVGHLTPRMITHTITHVGGRYIYTMTSQEVNGPIMDITPDGRSENQASLDALYAEYQADYNEQIRNDASHDNAEEKQ